MMGAQLRFGTAGATGGGWSSQPGSLQPALAEFRHAPHWSWQARSPLTWRDRLKWISRWSFGCRTEGGNGSGQDGSAPVGRDLGAPDLFEPFSCDGEGSPAVKWIKGLCVDASGVAVANAVVQGFVTSSDQFTGEVFSKNDGTYDVPTQNPGVNHYVVAYKAGSPDIAGTTVNTLVPANIDGT